MWEEGGSLQLTVISDSHDAHLLQEFQPIAQGDPVFAGGDAMPPSLSQAVATPYQHNSSKNHHVACLRPPRVEARGDFPLDLHRLLGALGANTTRPANREIF